MIYHNKKLKYTARTLRKNMTETEILLWSRVRRKQLLGFQFYRQRPHGNYIVDFYCPAAKLIIEIDGRQHYEEKGLRSDKVRDEYFSKFGFRVMRFSTSEVFEDIDSIEDEIYQTLEETGSSGASLRAESPSFPLSE
ncbi:MAG: hypothetical protein HW374_1608 [Bacteroidetes bacterium]|nr:hypothetical protein [Bacteroidota bacterium]